MYPIIIKRTPQKLNYNKKIKFNGDNFITMGDFKKLKIKDSEYFFIDYDNNLIEINGVRLENKKELNDRIKKEENYMKKYREFHSKKK